MIPGRVIAGIALLVGLTGCGERREAASPPRVGAPPEGPAAVRYEDVTQAAGIGFVHHSGAAGRKWLPETMGSGCAVLDANGDGRPDLLVVDSTAWKVGPKPPDVARGQCRLYLNRGDWKFQEVSSRWQVPGDLYGMGAAVADFDGDGWVDVFLSALDGSRLLRNEGGRRFRDVTRRWGLRVPGWPTGAAWLDYDRDGKLDLFVCGYVPWSPESDLFASLDGVHKTYARPDQYPPDHCRLFRQVDGRFVDVSQPAGIAGSPAKALGVALCDFDHDGWVDLAVSNDTSPNLLFHNQGTGKFKEVAVQAGVAVAEAGRARAGMGIDAADYDNSGQQSLLITNFAGEQLSLHHRDESGLFQDVAARAGIGIPSQQYLGFGACFLDADLDGWLDVAVANGHIQDDIGAVPTGTTTYAQPGLLFLGSGAGFFRDVSAASGALRQPRVARGLAAADLDADGDLDLLITTNRGKPALLRQAGKPANHWLRLRLEGRAGNRSAIGATVRLRAPLGAHGGQPRVQTRMVRSGSSYLSQSDLALTFGLGPSTRAEDVEVRWPDGSVETFGAVSADQEVRLRQGRR
jgi:hypothetical protein